jgi:hypothetical protein
MAENTIHIFFQPCEPAPANGYRITYRPQGSDEDLRTWPTNFVGSPAIFVDTLDALGTEYEGFIQGDCGDVGLGVPIPWQTGENSPGGEESPSPGEESPSPPAPCTIFQNTDVVNATNVSWIDCDGTPMGPTDITPGSNFCAQNDSVTGPDEGSLTDMGPCS